jgi:hypothetical protein
MKVLKAMLAAGALLIGGCEEPKLPKSWRITYARVLGVRAEVVGDEARATPEPGERVRVRVLVVGDRPIERINYALVACPATPARGELPSCASEPFVVDRGALGASQSLVRELVLELDVPEEDGLEGAERVLIGGTICTDGDAEPVEGGEGRCEGSSAQPVTFAAHITLALDDSDINRNPVIAHDAIRFDDEVWSPHAALDLPSDEDAGADVEASDAGPARSAAADGDPHEIEISLEASGREINEEGPEELMLSHYVTAGVLERRFSVLEREQDGSEPFLVKFHMPRRDDPPARVIVAFVLRDQRGGVGYALRELEIE